MEANLHTKLAIGSPKVLSPWIIKPTSFKTLNHLFSPTSIEGFNGLIRIDKNVHDLMKVIKYFMIYILDFFHWPLSVMLSKHVMHKGKWTYIPILDNPIHAHNFHIKKNVHPKSLICKHVNNLKRNSKRMETK